LQLGDLLGAACGEGLVAQDLRADVEAMLGAARAGTPELAFLGDAVDADRVALVGHSAGGRAVGSMSDLGQVIVPLAAGGVSPGGQVMSVLVMGGTQDAVVPYAQQLDGFEASPSPKRLVGIENAGHLAFAQL